MKFQDKLLYSHIAFEELFDVNNPIHDKRLEALKFFEKKGFPSRKDEAWKYTSLNSLINRDYALFPKKETPIELKKVKKFFLYEIDTYKIIFIDGVYSPFLSDTTHDGLDVCLMSAALSKFKYRKIIERYFGNVADNKDSLTALNTSYTREGAYIYVPKNVVAEKPIEIIHFSTGKEQAIWLQPRNLIVLDTNSQAQIIERHQSLKSHEVVTNSVTEIYTNQDALLDYYKIQNDLTSSSLIDNTYISQEKNSTASVHTFSLGGKLIRNNLNFSHTGQRINSTLKGITILDGNQHVDHYTLVKHSQPNCESFQEYKGIFSEKSKGVFNGKIFVESIAQKTNAFQQSNNLLLDDLATVNTKPQLEIFADDVKCSHGATIGQLEDDAVFYMQSRGIDKSAAKGILSYAFASEFIESIKHKTIKKHLRNKVLEFLDLDLD